MHERNSGDPPRVSTYVDGLNLYYGLRDAGMHHLQWLDQWRLAATLAGSSRRLIAVHYLVAAFFDEGADATAGGAQRAYLDALQSDPRIEVHLGYHLMKRASCTQCRARNRTFEKKLTDVKIALQVLCDAEDDRFDTALLVTADSDLAAVVETVLERHPHIKVFAVFPPSRSSFRLRSVASGVRELRTGTLRRSQLPEQVVVPDGRRIVRPRRWRG